MTRNQLQPRALAAPLMTNIVREMDQLQGSIRRMFDNPFSLAMEPFTVAEKVAWFPPVEITETANEMIMTAELPGLDRNDVHVELDGDTLILRGEKRNERIEGAKDTQYYLEERSYGAFQRAFTLPATVENAKIAAEFDKGVLTVRLPKNANAAPRGREIPINAK